MAIPVNRPVRVMLRSKDVTHSFFVPQLRVKQDAVPGMAIRVHFTAVKTGEYEIACAELCGMQHYKMRGRLLVMADDEFADMAQGASRRGNRRITHGRPRRSETSAFARLHSQVRLQHRPQGDRHPVSATWRCSPCSWG